MICFGCKTPFLDWGVQNDYSAEQWLHTGRADSNSKKGSYYSIKCLVPPTTQNCRLQCHVTLCFPVVSRMKPLNIF